MLRRVFDCLVAGSALVVAAPVLLGLALLVKSTSPGAVLYGGRRIGRGGRPFTIYKLRTMWSDTPASSFPLTKQGDARVTVAGRFLRRTKLDELPQLFNVLKGDMAVVGPRPEDPRYAARYTVDQRRVLDVRPGLVGAASLSYLHQEALLARVEGDVEDYYVNVVMPAKLRLELDYLAHRSFLVDLKILLRAAFLIPASCVFGNRTRRSAMKSGSSAEFAGRM